MICRICGEVINNLLGECGLKMSMGRSAAIAYTLIETAKLNGVDPQAWLTDVLSRMPTTRSIGSTSYCRGDILRLSVAGEIVVFM